LNSLSLLLALAFTGGQGATQDPVLTLDEAIKIAESNAFSVKIAQSNVEKTRQRIAEARGLIGPKVDATTTYTRFDRSSSSNGIVFQPNDSTTASLQFSMPLDLTGILSRGVRASEVTLRAAEAQVGVEKNNLRERVRQAYYGVLQSEALVKVAEETLKNARERLEVTRKEVEAGSKAKIDVIRIEAQVRQFEADLLKAQNSVRLSKQNLNNVLARPIETPLEPVDIQTLPTVNGTPEELVAKAQQQRPDIQAQVFNIVALALIRQAQESGLLPSLKVGANHQQNLGQTGFGGRKESTTGTLTLSIPLFDSGVTRARVKQARQDEKQAEIRLDETKLGVSLEVRQALSNLSDAWARYEVAQKGLELAAENYRLAKIRYEADEAILLEVVDAQTELTRAQSNAVTARYDYLSAYAALQRAVAEDNPGPAPVATNGGKN
jgi:outer membrane protein